MDIVRICDSVDVALSGPQYTWTNNQDDNPISKKLDRVMGNSCWISAFEQSHAVFEAGRVYDHSRMVTSLRISTPVNTKPFKFFTHVASHPRFLEVVNQVWNETPLFYFRSTLKRLQRKLKMLKSEADVQPRIWGHISPSHFKISFSNSYGVYEMPLTENIFLCMCSHLITFLHPLLGSPIHYWLKWTCLNNE